MSKQTHQYQQTAPIQQVYVSNPHRAAPANQNYPPELLRYPQDLRSRPVPAGFHHAQIVGIQNVVPGPGQKAVHPQPGPLIQSSQFIVDGHIANMHPGVAHHPIGQVQLQYPGAPAALRQHPGVHAFPYAQQQHPNQHVIQHNSHVMGTYRNVPHDQPFYYQTPPQSTSMSLSRDGTPSTVSNDPKHISGLTNVQQQHLVYKDPGYPQQNTMQAPMYPMTQPEIYQPNFSSASSNVPKTKTKKRSNAITIVNPDTQETVDIDDLSEQNLNSEKETSADKSGVCATFAAQVAAVANEPSAPKSVNEKENSQVTSHIPASTGVEVPEFDATSEEKSQPPNCNPEAVVASFKAEVSKLAYGAESVSETDNKNLVNPEPTHIDPVSNDKPSSKDSTSQEACDAKAVEVKMQVGPEPVPATITKTENSAYAPAAGGSGDVSEVSQDKGASQIVKEEVDFVRAMEPKVTLPLATPPANPTSVENPTDFSKKPSFGKDVEKSNVDKSTKDSQEETVQKYKVDSKKIESSQKPTESRSSQKRNRHNKNVPKSNEPSRRIPEKEDSEIPSNQATVPEKIEVKSETAPQHDIKKEESVEVKIENVCEKEKKAPETEVEQPVVKSNNPADDATSNISAEEKEVQEKNKHNTEESMNFAKSNEQVTISNKIDNEPAPPAEPTSKEVAEIDNNANSDNTSAKTVSQLLKYKYQDGQWSPVNTAGKKVYGREFLMKLQEDPSSQVKPLNLPDLDVVLSKCNIINQIPMDLRAKDYSRHELLLPCFVKSFNTKMPTPSKRGGGGHSEKQAKSNKPDLMRVSLRDVKLRETENAWKPRRAAPASGSEEEKSENLYKKVRSVLNKLTPQKFDTLVNQVRELEIDTEERLQGVIDLVFKKAIDEPNFSVAYALMCKELSNMAVNSTESGSANFRKLLINRCQTEFEKNTVDETARTQKLQEIEECADPERKKELQQTLEEEERIIRVRSVGNIRFIGELFKQNMLTCKIMDQCIRHLLLQQDEENLECLCKLLTTVGKVLETKKVDLSPYFKKMQSLTTQKGKVSSRIRFMLLDVIDLRANKWVPRRDDSNPKTMDQIQKEVETETLNIEINNSLMSTPRKDDRNSDKRGGGNARRVGGGSGRPVEDPSGWSMPSKSRQVYTVESAKLKNKPPAMDDLQLGSRSAYQWNQPPKAPAVTTPNKFAFLENMSEPKEQRPVANYRSIESSSRARDYPQRGQGQSSEYKFEGRSSRNSNYQSSSRSHSKVREQDKPEPQTPKNAAHQAPAGPPEIPEEDMPRKVNKYVEEYILEDGETVEQAIESFRATFPVSSHTGFVMEVVNILLGKKEGHQLKTSKVLSQLLSQRCISLEHFNAALKDLIEISSDMIIDIPKFWDYMAKLLVEHAVKHPELLVELKSMLQPPQESFLVFIADLMFEVNKLMGEQLTTDIWRKSEIKWTDFLDNQERIEQIIKQRNLDFLL